MKIQSYTPTEGETVIAFEASDTLPVSNSGSGSGSGITKFENIKIKKLPGLSTNELFKRTLAGTLLPEVDFEFYDASNTLYYKIIIKDVNVTHFSYLSPECSNCSSLSHQAWFDYVKIEVTDVINGSTLKYNRASRTFY